MSFVLAADGTIESWEVDGVPVLFPFNYQQYTLQDRENRRGGAPSCAPLFGVLSEEMRKPGLDMRIHGLVMGSDGKRNIDEHTAQWSVVHYADQQFAWDCLINIDVAEGNNSLTHTLLLQRSDTCTNTNFMPYSLGFHPYFATHGQLVRAFVENAEVDLSDPTRLKNSIIVPGGMNAQIHTTAGCIDIAATGNDEWCVWSDDVSRYICIEPIAGYTRFGTVDFTLPICGVAKLSTTLTFTTS